MTKNTKTKAARIQKGQKKAKRPAPEPKSGDKKTRTKGKPSPSTDQRVTPAESPPEPTLPVNEGPSAGDPPESFAAPREGQIGPSTVDASGPASDQPSVSTNPTAQGSAGEAHQSKPEGTSTREADSRMPEPGTLLQKRDRQGLLRCECAVEAEGVRYKGTLYRSLSAAALAAAKDLGLKAESANGFAFWGLSKPNRPRVQADHLAGLSKRWETYVAHVEAALEKTAAKEHRAALLGALERQARILMNLHAEAKDSVSPDAVAS